MGFPEEYYNTYLFQYYAKIDSGEILVSKAMHQEIARTKELLRRDDIYLNIEAGLHAVNWIERFLVFTDNELADKPFRLNLWQKAMLMSIFGLYKIDEQKKYNVNGELIGTEKTHKRLTLRSTVIVGSGNGKSTISANISLYMLLGSKKNTPKIFLASNTYNQAKLVYGYAVNVIKKSPSLKKLVANNTISLQESRGSLTVSSNFGELRTMARNAENLDGIAPSYNCIDEIALFRNAELVNNILKNELKVPDMLTMQISTNGTVRGGYFDNHIEHLKKILSGDIEEDTTRIFLYESDSTEELYEDIRNAQKANPQFPVTITEDTVRKALQEAMHNPQARPTILSKNFNISTTSNSIFFSADECEHKPFDEQLIHGTTGVFGLDMSLTTDLTALTYLTTYYDEQISAYVDLTKTWFFIPEQQMEKKLKEESVDYAHFIEQGDVILMKGTNINQKDILDKLYEIVDDYNLTLAKMVCDTYGTDFIVSELRSIGGQDYISVTSNGQYKKVLTPTIHQMKTDLGNNKLRFNSKLMTLHLAATQSEEDKDGYIKLTKAKQRHRIDGVMGLLYARKAKELYLLSTGQSIESMEGGSIYGDDIVVETVPNTTERPTVYQTQHDEYDIYDDDTLW